MTAPPRTIESILDALGAETTFRESVLGDLAEDFSLRAERDGIRVARQWYYREAVRTAPHLIRNWFRHVGPRDVAHLAGLALTSWVFVITLAGFALVASHSVLVALGPVPAVALPARAGPPPPLVAFTVGAGCVFVGGYIAAWLNRSAPLVGSISLGLMWAAYDLVVTAIVTDVPIWYWFAVPVVVTLAAMAGGILRVRRSPPAQWGTHVSVQPPAGS